MSDCLRDDQLDGVEALPEGDPRRTHAVECPKCRARLLALGAFREPASVPAGARPAEAREAMLRAVREKLGPAATVLPLPARSRRWGGPVLLAAAASLAIVLAWPWLRRSDEIPAPPIERGSPAGTATLETLPPTLTAESVALRWRALAGADSYQVAYLGADFTVIERSAATAETTLTIATRSPEWQRASGRVAYWQVLAFSDGFPLAEGAPVEWKGH